MTEPFIDETGLNRKTDWAIPDLLRRAVMAGVGAAFMTEEGIRSYLGELKLPKDVAQYVLNQVSRTKEELFRVLSQELHSFLESTRLTDVLRQVLTTTSLEISTKVRFVDESGSTQPKIRSRMKVVREPRKRSVPRKKHG